MDNFFKNSKGKKEEKGIIGKREITKIIETIKNKSVI